MAVSYAQDFTIGIFTSPNLWNWTHVSNFSSHGLYGNQWECPNLLQMPMVDSSTPLYLLFVSINPGAPQGGSISQYFPGTFNGTHFAPVDDVARTADFGKDNYASQFFYGISPNKPQISIAWASNWQYTNYVPTGPLEGWQSSMSLPRQNYLMNISRLGYDLISAPYNLNAVMSARPVAENPSLGNGTFSAIFGSVEGSSPVMLQINVTNLSTAFFSGVASLNFTFSSSQSGESLSGGQFFAADMPFFLDRSAIHGFQNPFYTGKFSTASITGDSWNLQAILDRSVFELFLLGGQQSATLSLFPEKPLDTIRVAATGMNPGASVSVAVWSLESTWKAKENAQGVVLDNVTATVHM